MWNIFDLDQRAESPRTEILVESLEELFFRSGQNVFTEVLQ